MAAAVSTSSSSSGFLGAAQVADVLVVIDFIASIKTTRVNTEQLFSMRRQSFRLLFRLVCLPLFQGSRGKNVVLKAAMDSGSKMLVFG